jgi:hypothetical protein
MDGDDRVLAIVLAAEHLLGFAGFDFRGQVVEPLRQVVEDRLTGLRPLDEDGEIVHPRLERIAQLDVVFETSPPLQQLLRRRLVFPEIGLGNALLYLGEFVRRAGGVKGSSADRSRAWRDPGIGGAAHLIEWWTFSMVQRFQVLGSVLS